VSRSPVAETWYSMHVTTRSFVSLFSFVLYCTLLQLILEVFYSSPIFSIKVKFYLDGWTAHLVVSFVKDQQMLKEIVDYFINMLQILPQHVSAYGCHPQGVYIC
jgi:hypothetical protein